DFTMHMLPLQGPTILPTWRWPEEHQITMAPTWADVGVPQFRQLQAWMYLLPGSDATRLWRAKFPHQPVRATASDDSPTRAMINRKVLAFMMVSSMSKVT